MADASGDAAAAAPVKNHNKYRKDKPWDHEGIDHWKIDVRAQWSSICVRDTESSWLLGTQCSSHVRYVNVVFEGTGPLPLAARTISLCGPPLAPRPAVTLPTVFPISSRFFLEISFPVPVYSSHFHRSRLQASLISVGMEAGVYGGAPGGGVIIRDPISSVQRAILAGNMAPGDGRAEEARHLGRA